MITNDIYDENQLNAFKQQFYEVLNAEKYSILSNKEFKRTQLNKILLTDILKIINLTNMNNLPDNKNDDTSIIIKIKL